MLKNWYLLDLEVSSKGTQGRTHFEPRPQNRNLVHLKGFFFQIFQRAPPFSIRRASPSAPSLGFMYANTYIAHTREYPLGLPVNNPLQDYLQKTFSPMLNIVFITFNANM